VGVEELIFLDQPHLLRRVKLTTSVTLGLNSRSGDIRDSLEIVLAEDLTDSIILGVVDNSEENWSV